MEVQYMKPDSLAEALALLNEYEGSATVIAGGTDLLVKKKKGLPLPVCMIDIKGIGDLNYVNDDGGSCLRIGALTTMETLSLSELVRRDYSALAEGVSVLASPQIRRMATIAGNICNAAPSADTSSPLIVLGAEVKLIGTGTERIVPVEDMFLGPGKTVLSKQEIISEIRIPKPAPNSASAYFKRTRRYGADLAVVGIAVALTLEGGVMKNVRIAEGAVGPIAFRAKKAESLLEGRAPEPNVIEAAAEAAMSEAKPITDVRGTKEYRSEMVKVLTRRATETALSRIERFPGN
jgi:carbon-monoxide dehydrogenase medium subunit